MKFYVASKFRNYSAVQEVVAALRSRGHTISFDWANNSIEFDEDGNLIKTAEELSPRQRTDFAIADLKGAQEADALLLLYVDEMRGAYIEVGAALAMGRIVYVIGIDIPFTIFWSHPNVKKFFDLKHFFEYIDAFGS